ncbi:MAG: DNA-deoxyinosine glycosylase [Clostridia bacterium]|nr:DNA-deoxyinosine glycosylase [Clostridia bacterium]
MIKHPIPPLYDKSSKILILGSFPSQKSREAMFFYGHPQNRFWRVLSSILETPLPQSIEEKKSMLLDNGIALWDSIASCDIIGSSDSSIKNVVPNDLTPILEESNIKAIFTNGKTSDKYFKKYNPTLSAICLPSTSPANASWDIERLVGEWNAIKIHL